MPRCTLDDLTETLQCPIHEICHSRLDPLDAVNLEAMDDERFAHLKAPVGEAQQYVTGWGRSSRPAVAFVGEAPGRQEDEQGRPFVGAAGQLLFKHVIAVTGLTRESVWTTNVVKYRPPGNRTPWPAELLAGAHYLRRELVLVRPRVIVTLGNAALSVMVPRTQITKIHGKALTLASGRQLMPMYHPAYLLRRKDLIDEFTADLAALRRLIEDDT